MILTCVVVAVLAVPLGDFATLRTDSPPTRAAALTVPGGDSWTGGSALDVFGRLIGEERGGDAAVNATYGYDENGNRSTVIRYASPQSKSEDFSHVATTLLPSLDSGWQVADGLLSANLPTAGGTVALALTSGTDVHGPLLSVQVNPLLANGATGFVAAGLRLTLDATTAYRAQWSRQWSSDFAQVRQGQVVLEKVTTSGGVSTVTVLAMSLLQTETTVSPVTISVMRGADGLLTVTAANATVGTITLEATVASSPDDVAPSAVSLEVTASGNSAANTTYDHISWTTSPSRTVRRNDYDGLDRLMAHAEVNDVGVTTARTTYGRDALGRLINRTAAGGSVIASYAYDALDRQQSITEGGITTISAYIGSEWMRRSTTPSVGAPTTWTYDDQGITSRVSGTNTTTYQRHGGSLLWENGTTNGASSTNSYALDLHGNVTGIAGTITNGQLTMDAYRQRFDYDAWGQIVRERYGQVDQNNLPNYYPVSTISSGPRYRGMWYDGGAKGVYKTETRLYDPELGQFLQEDPARKKENWFSYAGSDPVNRSDPTGLDWEWNDESRKWDWVPGVGEIADANPPEWARPQFIPSQVNPNRPLLKMSTALALLYNFRGIGYASDEAFRAAGNLGNLVGQGAPPSNAQQAAVLFKFAEQNAFANGADALAGYEKFYQSEVDRLSTPGAPPQSSWHWTGQSPAQLTRGGMEFVIENTPVYAFLNAAVKDKNRSNVGTAVAVGTALLAVIPMQCLLAGGAKKALSRSVATASNYRDLFLKKANLPDGWVVHHSLPQKFERQLEEAGLNIHEPAFMRGVSPDVHDVISTKWVRWEKQFVERNGRSPYATDVAEFAKEIDDEFFDRFIFAGP